MYEQFDLTDPADRAILADLLEENDHPHMDTWGPILRGTDLPLFWDCLRADP